MASAHAQSASWITPTAPGLVATTPEDTAYTTTLVANPPGGSSSPTVVAVTDGSTVIPTANVTIGPWTSVGGGNFSATLTATPLADRNTPRDNAGAPVIITLTLSGAGGGAGSTRTIQLTVSEVNDPPVARDDTLSAVNQDSGLRIIPAANLLANDDPGPLESSHQTISVTGVSNPVGGTVALNGSNLEFTLAPGFSGVASFTYQITDTGSPPLSATATASFTVNPVASTTTTITGTSTGASALTRENFTVDFSVAGGSPTGSVTVSAFAGAVSIASCNGALTGGATATGSCALNTLRASDGITRLVASYAGDADDLSSTSADFTFSVARSQTSVALASGGVTTMASSTPFGETVRLTASVTADAPGGGPVTGTVRFVRTVGNITLGEVALDGSGMASFDLTGGNAQPVGARQYTAILLEPNADYVTSNGDATHTVVRANTATTLSAIPTAQVNATVTVTASVAAVAPGAGTPTGTIVITGDDTTGCTITLPAPSCTLSFSAKGSKNVAAAYSGDDNFNTSSDTETATVLGIPTAITLAAPTPAPIYYGNAFSVPFTVTGGDGTFEGAVTVTATGPSPAPTTFTCTTTDTDGSGSCSTFSGAPLGAGTYALTATYAGDPSDAESATAAATALTILRATTAVSVTTDPNPSTAGATVTLTPVVTITNGTGTVNGTVSFTATGYADGTCPASVTGASPATGNCTGVFSTFGAQAVTANFAPTDSANYESASNATHTHTVNTAATTVTAIAFAPAAPDVGDAVTVSFDVNGGTGTYDGTIAVTVDAAPVTCSAPAFDNVTGIGSCGIPASFFQAAQDYAINVAFVPGTGSNDGASNADASLTVGPRPTTATLSALPASPQPAGTLVTFTANVASVGGTFFAPGTAPSGSAFVCLAAASPCDATSAICTITLAGSAGTSSGTCNTTFDSAAIRSLVVRFAGNLNFDPATSAAIAYETTAAPTSIAITSFSPVGNTVVGEDLLVNFDVNGGTGDITGTVDIAASGPAGATASCVGASVNPATGIGSCTFDGSTNGLLRAGAWSVIASFVPAIDSNDGASSSAPQNRTVDRAGTQLILVSEPDPSVFGNTFALRATVTALPPSEAVPTGNVDFQNNLSTSIGLVALDASGVAVLSGLSRDAGSYNFRAATATNADFFGAQDLDETHTVDKADQVIEFPQPVPQTFSVGGSFGVSATANSAVTTNPSGLQVAFSTQTPVVCSVGASTGTTPSTATVNILSGGTCTIRASAPMSSNFNAASVDRDIAIARAAQTISFGVLSNVSLDTLSRIVSATSDSGLIVSLSSQTPAVCAVTAPGTSPATVTYSGAGICTLRASQAGDASYNPATDVDRSFQVVSITVDPATLAGGTFGVPYSATVSASGGAGAYTFAVTTGALPTGLILNSGTGAITGTPTAPGDFTFTITATDSDGAGPFVGSRGYMVTVAKFQSTLALARINGSGPVNPGATVELQATLSDATDDSVTDATGTVNFFDNGTAIAACANVALSGPGPYTASCTTTALGQGARTLTAVYSGDANYLTATSNDLAQVVRTTTTLTLDAGNPTTAVFGQTVTLAANLAGGVTPYQGSVTINAGAAGTCTDTDVLAGAASCDIGPLPVGVHTVTASYTGSDDDAAATTTISGTLTVGPAATTTALAASPAAPTVLGTAVTLTATVSINAPGSGTPTGTVEFRDGASVIAGCATQPLNGSAPFTATCVTSALPVGTRGLSAGYSGDANTAASNSAALDYLITRKPVTVAITSAPDTTLGGSTLVAVSVTPVSAGTTPSGEVTVSAGPGESCSITLTGGAGSCALTLNTAGARTITAAYPGDGDHLSGADTDTVDVARGTSTTALSIVPAASASANAPVTFNAVVTTAPPAGGTLPVNVPAATGAVSVRGTDSSQGGADVALCSFVLPATSCEVTFPTQRTLGNVRAIYAGDGNFDGSTSTPGQAYSINAVATTTTLGAITPAVSFTGQPIAVAYTVAGGVGSNEGEVTVTATLTSGGPYSTSCTASASAGTCTLTPLRAGTYNIVATYAGDPNDAPSTSATVSRIVSPATTTTTLTVSPATSSPVGTAVQLSATVTANAPGGGTPSGNLVFLRNGSSIAVVPLDGTGTATFTDTVQPVGNYIYRAQFDSTADYVISFDEEAHRVTGLNADLSNLVPSAGTLTPAFNAAQLSYAINVANAVSSISLTPTVAQAGATVTVNGAPTASGSASAPVALAVGPTAIPVVVTSESGTVTRTYTVTVTRAPNSNADLSALVLSTGTLNPAFAAGTTSYTASVANAVTSLTVTPTVAATTSTVTVNGTAVVSGSASGAINLAVGPNTITVVVTAQDSSTKTYTVTVTRAANSNADLSALVLSNGTLTPAFAAGTTSYTASVANAVTSLTVTPTVAATTSTVTVNGVAVVSGTASTPINVAVGPNTITVVVTAEDSSTRTYTVAVTRAPNSNADLSALALSTGTLNPAFAAGTTSYTASVANAVSSLTVTPTVAATTSTVTVNGIAVISGTASGAINLAVGPNTITVVVTAEDASTRAYTVTVTRAPNSNADLSALALSTGTLNPAFAAGTTSYTASVANAVTSLTVTPTVAATTSTVTVNGTAVVSGTASTPINLAVGPNTITLVVTAEDNSTKTYSVVVTRAANSNADLSALVISEGTLTPAFAAGTTSYTASVANAVTSLTVTPTVAATTSTVTVNGTPVASGTASAAINLAVGPNTVTVVVTAEDSSTQTYTVTVTRAANSNADLSALVLSNGTLTPAFAAGTTSYTASVANAVTSLTVTPTVAATTSTVTVNGTPVASGTASAAINLAVGPNTVTVVVTAQDASTRTYTVTVTRASNVADLSVLMQGSYGPGAGNAQFTIVVSNPGPANVLGAVVASAVPSGVTATSFTCSGSSGGICGGSYPGTGAINRTVDLPAGASVTFSVVDSLAVPQPETTTRTATVTAPTGIVDPNTSNNSASATLANALFADGFEAASGGASAMELGKGLSGAWNDLKLPLDLFSDAVVGVHPVEAIRFVRGNSTLVVQLRRFDGRVQAQLLVRSAKAGWTVGEWVPVDATGGVVLNWLASPLGDAVEAAELRGASR